MGGGFSPPPQTNPKPPPSSPRVSIPETAAYSDALRGLLKDQELANAAASEVGFSLFAGKEAMKLFQAAINNGSGEDDIASILLAVEKLAQD